MSEPTKGIIYYTDNRLDDRIGDAVRAQLSTIGLPIVITSLHEPVRLRGMNYVLPLERGYLTMFKQILTCLNASKSDIIYFCEHDVLYPKEHFDFTPPSKEKFYYDLNWWKVRADGLAVHWDAVQVSGLVAYRDVAIKWYEDRIETFDKENFDRKFEPTVDAEYETFRATKPHIDIRHEWNLTYNKWKIEHFRKKDTAVNLQHSTIDKLTDWPQLKEIFE